MDTTNLFDTNLLIKNKIKTSKILIDEKDFSDLLLKLREFYLTNKDFHSKKLRPLKLSMFKTEYLEYCRHNNSTSYLESITLSFNQMIKYAGDIPLNEISVKLVDHFITTVYSRSKFAANLYYGSLKAAFSKAVIWEYINENPFKKIKAPKLIKAFPIFISLKELNKILAHEEKLTFRNLYTCAFYTGMRLGELLNMKWSWIDLYKNSITVKCTNSFSTKSKRERLIPINPKLRKILVVEFSKRIDITYDSFVFHKYSDVRFNEDYVSKTFKKAVRDAELNDSIHFHTLRHSFASNLVQKGASLYEVKELLGHQDYKTTQIYSHLQQENLYRAINLL